MSSITKNKIIILIKRFLRIFSMPILIPLTLARQSQQNQDFPDGVSIVAIAKDEGPYIREWVEFYKIIGASRIYLYDNGSTDGMKEKIQDFIDDGFVVYTPFPGIAKQYDAYMDAITHYKNRTKYMAFLDCDEFLMPCNTEQPIMEVVDNLFVRYGKHVGGIAVNWMMYGSSGHQSKPQGLVLEEYLKRRPNTYHSIKTIANPRAILKYCHAHYPIYLAGFKNVDIDGQRVDGAYNFNKLPVEPQILRLNHYYTKSHNEFLKRHSRRAADHKKAMIESREVLESKIAEFDSDVINDNIGLEYAKKIKRYDEAIRKGK